MRFLTIALVITLVLVVRRDTKRVRLSEERLAITLQSIGDAVIAIGMPGMNGYQVAEQVRADPRSSQPVPIALTGWGQAQDLERAHAAGFDHHLVKPADPSAVRALLQRQ